ncbi:MAG TPA: hypothetical protein VMT22_23110 [Terriglobales bacterium]|nr:hypothetical protein [Terriglobales bacterium]
MQPALESDQRAKRSQWRLEQPFFDLATAGQDDLRQIPIGTIGRTDANKVLPEAFEHVVA